MAKISRKKKHNKRHSKKKTSAWMDLEEAPTLKVMPDDPDEDAPPKQKPAVPIYTEERVLEIQVHRFTPQPTRRFLSFAQRLQRDSISSSKLNRLRFNLFSSETQRHVAFDSLFSFSRLWLTMQDPYEQWVSARQRILLLVAIPALLPPITQTMYLPTINEVRIPPRLRRVLCV